MVFQQPLVKLKSDQIKIKTRLLCPSLVHYCHHCAADVAGWLVKYMLL